MSVENTYTVSSITVHGKGDAPPLWQVDCVASPANVTIPPTAVIQCDGVVTHASLLPAWFGNHHPARLDTTEDGGAVTSARFGYPA